jgi:hypothetical protein
MNRPTNSSREPGASSSGPEFNYEASDAHVRPVVIAGGLLALGVAICFAVAAVLLPSLPSIGPERSFRHGTQNDSTIVRDWRAQDEQVREHLEHYAWVDRKEGIVRIPIERAMELIANDEWHGSETRATKAAAAPEKTP